MNNNNHLNDFGFTTISADDYEAQQTQTVDAAKEVVSGSVAPELEKMNDKISSLTETVRSLQTDLSDRKEELKDKWNSRMNEVESLVLPLLKNLAKDGDSKEWIRWPNRTQIINSQIDKILSITRSDF